MHRHHDRNDQQRHDVDDLDQRVDGRTGGVFVRVANGVAGHGCFVGFRALAAVVAVLDVFLGVIPGTAAGAHGNGHEQTGDDGAHQQAAQGRRPEDQADHNGRNNRQQAGDHHLFDGRCGQHVHSRVVLGLARAVHDALDVAKLTSHFHHDRARSAADRFHGHGTEEVGNQAADEQADDDFGVAQVELDVGTQALQFVGVVGEKHQRSQTGRADGVAFGDGFGGVAHRVQRIGDVAHAGRKFGHFGDTAGVVGDGAVGVERDHDAGHAQHGGGGNGNAVQAAQVKGAVDGGAHKQHRPCGGAHGHAQAGDDVGAVAGGGGLGNVLHRGVLGAGVVLGNPDQGTGQDQADGAGTEQAAGSQRSAVRQRHRRGKHRIGHKVEGNQR